MPEINEKTGKIKVSSRGGARSGAGRPKGGSNKLSGQKILDCLEEALGVDYATQLAVNYSLAHANQDKDLVLQYDKLFLSKVVADKVEVDVIQSEELIQAKKEAFTEALLAMTTISTRNK